MITPIVSNLRKVTHQIVIALAGLVHPFAGHASD
jgi:hypothetical protein